MYTHTYIYIHIYVCIYIYKYIYTYIHVYTFILIYTYTFKYIYIYVNKYAFYLAREYADRAPERDTRACSKCSRFISFVAERNILSPVLTRSFWRAMCCCTRALWLSSTAVTAGRCVCAYLCVYVHRYTYICIRVYMYIFIVWRCVLLHARLVALRHRCSHWPLCAGVFCVYVHKYTYV